MRMSRFFRFDEILESVLTNLLLFISDECADITRLVSGNHPMSANILSN
jgi:hypothetical protein